MAQKLPSAKLLQTKDNYFRVAIDEACEAFNKALLEVVYPQK